jgi:hypothetical protein
MEENPRRYAIRNEEVEFKDKIIVASLTDNTAESYAFVSKMDEDKTPKKIMNVERKLRSPRDRDGNNKLGRMSHRRKVERKRKLRRKRFFMTEVIEKDWSLDDPQVAEKSKKRE